MSIVADDDVQEFRRMRRGIAKLMKDGGIV